MTDRELMQYALRALEASNAYDWSIVAALRERLAQPEQEPVGEIVQAFADLTAVSIPVMPPIGTKLYTTPPRCPNCESLEAQNTELDAKLAQMEWKGLTPEDVEELIGFHSDTNGHMGEADAREFAADLQARLKERNASVLTLRAADKEVS